MIGMFESFDFDVLNLKACLFISHTKKIECKITFSKAGLRPKLNQ